MSDNWERLIEEYEDLIGMVFEDERTGELFRFFGLVHGGDDYYYGMNGIDGARNHLVTCVLSLEGAGFKLLEDFVETYCSSCRRHTLKPIVYSDHFGPKELFIEDIEAYECTKCHNQYHSSRQSRAKHDKIHAAYDKVEDA